MHPQSLNFHEGSFSGSYIPWVWLKICHFKLAEFLNSCSNGLIHPYPMTTTKSDMFDG